MEPPPELLDELVGEILLRLPPDDPALLLRASLVCKPWLRLLTDAAFLRRYRAFHQTPPLLGFLRREKDQVTHFVPTASFRPRDPDRRRCRVLDCRHGRVLLYDRDLLVWDPVTGEEWHIPDAGIPYSDFNASVMCAAADCDHRDCHGGPFFVALVRTTDGTEDEWFTHACVYSSEAGEWSAPTTLWGDFIYFQMLPPVLAGDTLYFIFEYGDVILRYILRGERNLSEINGPDDPSYKGIALIPAEDGGLRFAGLIDFSLDLWSLERMGSDGVARWTHLMEVGMELPIADSRCSVYLAGYGKGPDSDVIYLSTDVGIFSFELESHKIKKVCERGVGHYPLFPYMSFLTPDRAVGRLSSPAVAL